MKRPNLEMRVMEAIGAKCLLEETLEAMHLSDQRQCAGADSALLSGESNW